MGNKKLVPLLAGLEFCLVLGPWFFWMDFGFSDLGASVFLEFGLLGFQRVRFTWFS
jgi:hypothetical protein